MKIIKYILLLFALFIISFFLWFGYQSSTSQDRQNNDIDDCLKQIIITDKPSFCIKNNSRDSVKELKFLLLKDNMVIQKIVLKTGIENKNGYFIFSIPFGQFLRKDIIEVFNKKVSCKISGFGYNSDGGHWGAFGYLGDAKCNFDYTNILINGVIYKGME